MLIGISGLAVGQTVTIPGDDITDAVKRYWRHGLFSSVSITAEKSVGNKVYLKISLTQRPRITDIRYYGIKKSDREDLQAKLGLVKGSQVTPNLIDRAKILIKKHFDEKGFKNAEVNIVEREDPENKEQVYIDVNIDKKEKVKVHKITIEGNQVLTDKKLKRIMKKTNEKVNSSTCSVQRNSLKKNTKKTNRRLSTNITNWDIVTPSLRKTAFRTMMTRQSMST